MFLKKESFNAFNPPLIVESPDDSDKKCLIWTKYVIFDFHSAFQFFRFQQKMQESQLWRQKLQFRAESGSKNALLLFYLLSIL